MGVPVAQSMFAGASLITTYLLSAQNKSLISPVSLDAAARYVLISFLQVLETLSDGKVSKRISMNHTLLCAFMLYFTLLRRIEAKLMFVSESANDFLIIIQF